MLKEGEVVFPRDEHHTLSLWWFNVMGAQNLKGVALLGQGILFKCVWPYWRSVTVVTDFKVSFAQNIPKVSVAFLKSQKTK